MFIITYDYDYDKVQGKGTACIIDLEQKFILTNESPKESWKYLGILHWQYQKAEMLDWH